MIHTGMELLPCPFCGSPVKAEEQAAGVYTNAIECSNEDCLVEGPAHVYLPDAVKAWNMRASEHAFLSAVYDKLEIIERLAFSSHAPNTAVPQIMQECIGLREAINARLATGKSG